MKNQKNASLIVTQTDDIQFDPLLERPVHIQGCSYGLTDAEIAELTEHGHGVMAQVRAGVCTTTARRATTKDAEALSVLFRTVYANSSHPFQSVSDIQQFLSDERNIEIIYEENGDVVAGAAMTYCEWNDSYELGRAITKPDFRKRGLAQSLLEEVIRVANDSKRGSVFFGFPRVCRIAEIAAGLTPAFVSSGHDGGRNVVDGRREVHLIMYSIPTYANFPHVAPPAELFKSSFLRETIYGRLGLGIKPGEYPPTCFVGFPGRHERHDLGFVFDYDLNSASRSIEIIGYHGETNNPATISAKLDQLLEAYPDVQHDTVTVLADKVDLVRALVDHGFVFGAYLPAWYPWGRSRFDCVQLFRARFTGDPRIQGFEEIVGLLRRELPGIYERPSKSHSRTSDTFSGVRSSVDQWTWRPDIFTLANEAELRACEELIGSHPDLQILDSMPSQFSDLLRSRRPGYRFTADELKALVEEHLAGRSMTDYGVWVHYPWSRRLVHLLGPAEFAELRTNRNLYKITPQEQATLGRKRIGVVGLSVGQSAALTLSLERSFGEIRLADFDSIDLSNLNRIRTGIHSLGLPKVIVTAREIMEIDPFLSITIFNEGITPDNVEAFLTRNGALDVIIEECDSLDVKCLVREGARRHRIPVVMETSDRGMVDIERFDVEPRRPIFHGLAGDLDPVHVRGLTTKQKIPFVLRIVGEETLSTRLRASLFEVDQTISTWPQLGSAVALGGGLAADAARRIMLNDGAPSGRYFFDLDDLTKPLAKSPAVVPQVLNPPATASPKTQAVPIPEGALTLDRSALSSLVERACLAPSGGNTQPWIWRADGPSLHLLLDTSRTCGLLYFENGASYAALGAAAESLRLAARNERLEMSLDAFPSADGKHAASFHFFDSVTSGTEPHWRDELSSQLAIRCTNRRCVQRQTVSPAKLNELTGAVRSVPGADLQWLTEPAELERIGDLIAAGDRLRTLHPTLHSEMFKEIRWDRQEVESRRDGLDVETLGLSEPDLAGLRMCRLWPPLQLLKDLGLGRKLESLSRDSIRAASAVGLITMQQSRPVDYFNGGRALQRMWLSATQRNIAVHPVTTLPYFFALIERGTGQQLDNETIAAFRGLRTPYKSLFAFSFGAAEVFLFRIFPGAEAERRSLRRRVQDVLHFQVPQLAHAA
jgi:N-acetylglutamate synthase-like GNAT family acetyltransferase